MYISLDLGGTALKYGFGTPQGGLLHHGVVPVADKTRAGILALLMDTVSNLLGQLPAGARCRGIALGSPGIVDADAGKILGHCPNLPQWQGAEPGPALRERFGLPVWVDNDANLMAYGEAARFGYTRTVLGITLGTGIGSGLVTGRSIYTGAHWAGLELGHVIVEAEGRPCACGKRGCIEAYASAPSLVALATEAEMQMHGLQSETTVNSIDKMTVKQVLDNMVDNQVIHAVVLRQMDRLGLLLSNAVTVLDPDVLLIGGGVSEIESFPLAALETALRRNLAAGLQAGLVVQKALLGNQAALVGGMWRCLHRGEGE